MHRDVKPKNILVNKSGQIKLCDFGTSKLVNNSFATTRIGTDAYLPPEAFTDDDEKFDVRREVWALGLIIAEVAFGKYPIGEGKLTDRISKCIKKATSEEIIRKSMQNFDDDIKEFAGLCLQELKNRPKYEPMKETQLYKKYLGLDRIQLFRETLENSNLF
uniref:mitogen-activated protein kinase kinase n=1 Tax=Acrobeloides nanus TaxID=290746 RepID=A0A914CQT0_9BILA